MFGWTRASWLPSLANFKPTPRVDAAVVNWELKVNALIHTHSGDWNLNFIQSLFDRDSASAILQLPPPCAEGVACANWK